MATGNPCKKCKRDCIVPGLLVSPVGVIPPIFADLQDPFNSSINMDGFLDYIKNGIQNNNFCDGDIAAHCLQAILDKIRSKIGEFFVNAINQKSLPFGQCYDVYFDRGISITANCKCNDEDISNGNGPPSAKVDVTLSGPQTRVVSCGKPT